ncbi:MAG: tetratricopeptide (TPR) repeat protein [Arenicella sp.]|jgi:tetratricopeptide (TPR) repeat protein
MNKKNIGLALAFAGVSIAALSFTWTVFQANIPTSTINNTQSGSKSIMHNGPGDVNLNIMNNSGAPIAVEVANGFMRNRDKQVDGLGMILRDILDTIKSGEYEFTSSDASSLKSAINYTSSCLDYFLLGSELQATTDCSRSIELSQSFSPLTSLNYYLRGTTYYYAGKYDQALPDFLESERLGMAEGGVADLSYFLSKSYEKKEQLVISLKYAKKAVLFKPKWIDARLNRAVLYQLNGMKDKAIADFKYVCEKSETAKIKKDSCKIQQLMSLSQDGKSVAERYRKIARDNFSNTNYEDAISNLQVVVSMYPESSSDVALIGAAYYQMDQLVSAKKYLDKACDLGDKNACVFLSLPD